MLLLVALTTSHTEEVSAPPLDEARVLRELQSLQGSREAKLEAAIGACEAAKAKGGLLPGASACSEDFLYALALELYVHADAYRRDPLLDPEQRGERLRALTAAFDAVTSSLNEIYDQHTLDNLRDDYVRGRLPKAVLEANEYLSTVASCEAFAPAESDVREAIGKHLASLRQSLIASVEDRAPDFFAGRLSADPARRAMSEHLTALRMFYIEHSAVGVTLVHSGGQYVIAVAPCAAEFASIQALGLRLTEGGWRIVSVDNHLSDNRSIHPVLAGESVEPLTTTLTRARDELASQNWLTFWNEAVVSRRVGQPGRVLESISDAEWQAAQRNLVAYAARCVDTALLMVPDHPIYRCGTLYLVPTTPMLSIEQGSEGMRLRRWIVDGI